MKKIIFSLLFLSILLFVLVFSSFRCASNLINSVLSGDINSFNRSYNLLSFISPQKSGIELLPGILDGKYLVLLQNNYEIRATGGFMGSFLEAEFKDGVLIDWNVSDIYTPDGAVKGRVKPLAPFQQAFKTGEYRLPNSNWNYRFPETVKDILWFFDKAGYKDYSGVVAINFNTIQNIVSLVEPMVIAEYGEELSFNNFYFQLQSHSQDDFFPGSQAKGNYLNAVGGSLVNEIKKTNILTKIKIFDTLVDELKNGEILLWHNDPYIEELILQNNWGGILGSYELDYFFLVESNLGSNKSNYCVSRSVLKDIITGSEIKNFTKITYFNNKDVCLNSDMSKWMGKYVNYQRIIIPSTAKIESVSVGKKQYALNNGINPENPPDINEDFSYKETIVNNAYKEIGYWVVVDESSSQETSIYYTLPNPENKDYSILISKQPGIDPIPYIITVDGIENTFDLNNKMLFSKEDK